MIYVVTTEVRVTATYTDLAGATANPTSVVCIVEAPDGTTTTPGVTNSAAGVYYSDVTLDQAGRWKVEFQGTGAIVAAGDVTITARASAVDA